MKFWSVMVLALALSVAGFMSAVHAGASAGHDRHDTAHAEHDHGSLDETSKDASAKSVCEVVCHATASLTVMPFSSPLHDIVAETGIASVTGILISDIHLTLDQPPRLS